MSDVPTPTVPPTPDGADGAGVRPPASPGVAAPSRDAPRSRRLDPAVLPIVAGVVVLGGALTFLFATPRTSIAPGEDLRGRVASVESLSGRVQQLEARAEAASGLPGRLGEGEQRLGQLEGRLGELAARPVGDPSNRPAIEALGERVGVLDAREAEAARRLEERAAAVETGATQRAGALEARLTETGAQLRAALEANNGRIGEAEGRFGARLTETERSLAQRVGEAERQLAQRLADAEAAIAPRLAALDRSIAERVDAAGKQIDDRSAAQARSLDERLAAQGKALDDRLAELGRRVAQAESAERRVGFLAARGSIESALEAGRPLGQALTRLPGAAPDALRRYGEAAPPTEASLRLSFADAARSARASAEPQGQGVMDTALARLEGLVTVRRGEQVVVGDTVSGQLEQARRALDAGDLGAAVERLDAMAPQPKAAMADWLGRARGLLAARAALRDLAVPGREDGPRGEGQGGAG